MDSEQIKHGIEVVEETDDSFTLKMHSEIQRKLKIETLYHVEVTDYLTINRLVIRQDPEANTMETMTISRAVFEKMFEQYTKMKG